MAPHVLPCPFAVGILFGTSRGLAVGAPKNNSARGSLECFSESRVTALTWTRGVAGVMQCTSGGEVSVLTKIISVTASAGSTATLVATVRPDHKGILLSDVGKMVYALWGYDGITDLRTIEIGRERIVMWCNAAMQLIFARAERLEYFNRDRIDVVVASAAGAALPEDVQRVQGNASISGRSLRPLGSKDEVDNFTLYYGGSEPIGFLVESLRTAGADSLAMTLYLAPAPSGNTTVKLDVTKNPPRFDAADLLSGVIIPLPHKWVETLFVPIVRKWASADGKMPGSLRQEQIAEINGQFETAKQILGLANISPETTQKGGEEQTA